MCVRERGGIEKKKQCVNVMLSVTRMNEDKKEKEEEKC